MVPQIDSTNPDQRDETPQEPLDVHEEISSLRSALNQTRTEMSLHRRRMDRRQDEVEAQVRRTNRLLFTTLVVAVLSAAVWLGYRNQDALARFSASSTENRPSPVEEKTSLPNPVNDAGQNPVGGVEQSSVKPNDGNPIDPVQQRENSNAAEAVPTQERPANGNNSNNQPLADGVNRNRIDFKISRNKTEEVAPGIYLTVRETNGWLQIAEDGRTVQFRDLRAQKSMTFNTKRDARARQLVFTQVDRNSVAGYLLIPS